MPVCGPFWRITRAKIACYVKRNDDRWTVVEKKGFLSAVIGTLSLAPGDGEIRKNAFGEKADFSLHRVDR